ncbi:MAG: hypothetical protein ABIP93_06530 [Gemmatimonadaceae bacterium]
MRAHRLALAALVMPASVWAQGEVAQTCDVQFLIAPDKVAETLRPSHPDVAYGRMSERMARNEWVFLVDSVRRSVLADPLLGAAERQQLLTQLGATYSEIVKEEAAGGRSTLQAVKTARFGIARPVGNDTNEYTLFLRFPPALNVSPLDAESRRAVCWTALAMGRLLSAYAAPARASATDALKAAVTRWDNYGSKGYSQYPWELALNSRGYDARSFDPPRTQKILLHPALGLELVGSRVKSLDDLTNLQTTDVVTLEPVGYLVYNASRSFYWGASAIVTLADQRRIGAGAMLHLGQSVKAGYAWRKKDDSGSRGQSFIISADLYQFFKDTPQKLKDWKSKALSQGITALAQGR